MTPHHTELLAAGWRQDPHDPDIYHRRGFVLRYVGGMWRAIAHFPPPRKRRVGAAENPAEALRVLGHRLATSGAHGSDRAEAAERARWLAYLRPVPPNHDALTAAGWAEAMSHSVVYTRGPVAIQRQDGTWLAYGAGAGVAGARSASLGRALESLRDVAVTEAMSRMPAAWRVSALLLDVARACEASP
jgi:hypothetical protein